MTDKKNPRSLKVLPSNTAPLIVSIVGNSGSGKTTFLEKLIPELKRLGLRVGTIKHDVHGFQMDKPGKDSWRHKNAGASTTIISSPEQIGVVMDVGYDHSIDELLGFFSGMDIILTEGYKHGNHPKLEVFRSEITAKPLCLDDERLMALISDDIVQNQIPIYATSDIKGVADFLVAHFKLNPPARTNCSETGL